MRERKYRAWDRDNECMVYSGEAVDEYSWGFEKGKLVCYVIFVNPASIDEPEHLDSEEISGPMMDFTGLKDKNGTEGYKDDIVKDTFSGVTWQISWHEEKGCWYLQPISNNLETWATIGIEYLEDFEIIGNIYENPELLTDDPTK